MLPNMTRERWLQLKDSWRAYLATKSPHEAWHHLLWLLIRERPVSEGFIALSNPSRVEKMMRDQHRNPDYKYTEAMSSVRSALNMWPYSASSSLALRPTPCGLFLEHSHIVEIESRLSALPAHLPEPATTENANTVEAGSAS